MSAQKQNRSTPSSLLSKVEDQTQTVRIGSNSKLSNQPDS
jgi:hypothetical protein